MNKSNPVQEFNEFINQDLLKIFNKLVNDLAVFLNVYIIGAKFEGGFPGYRLQKETIRRKKNDKVGIKTGKLQQAATLLPTWEVRHVEFGRLRQVLKKKKHGLTAYSSAVFLKHGGELDFLKITERNEVEIGLFLKYWLHKEGIESTGLLKIIRKTVPSSWEK